jgi:IQ calmodulin-binding motif
MENLVHIKPKEIKIDFKLDKWYGTKYMISKAGNNLYLDSSMQKQTINRVVQQKRVKKLIKQYSITKLKLKNVLSELEEISIQKNTIKRAEQDIENRRRELIRMNIYAVKIQAAVRGYLTRKRFENVIINISKKKVYEILDSLKETEKYCFLEVGLIVKNAALKLQKFIKKFLFRKKIKRISDAYYAYLETLKSPLYSYITQTMLFFYSRLEIHERKLEKAKILQLTKIREKRAIRIIKAFFDARKLKVKGLKNKIGKYKRLLRLSHQANIIRNAKMDAEEKKNFYDVQKRINTVNMISPSPAPINLSNQSSGTALPNTSTLKVQETTLENKLEPSIPLQKYAQTLSIYNDSDFLVESLYEQEKQRNKKIKQGLSSLGIYKSKNSKIIPILYQKEVEMRPGTHHIDRTNASIIRMSESIPSRSSPKVYKKPEIRIRSAIPKRKILTTVKYLNQTITSSLHSKDYSEIIFSNKNTPKKPTKNKIFEQTITSLQKTKPKQQFKTKSLNTTQKNDKLLNKEFFKIKSSPKNTLKLRIQTPKSNKSACMRRQSASIIRERSEFSPTPLNFQAGLPEYPEILTSLLRPLYVNIKPRL